MSELEELNYENIAAIASYLKEKTQIVPDVGVICGSGLGGLGDNLDEDRPRDVFPYGDIPNFPKTTGKESITMLLYTYHKAGRSASS